MKTLWMTFWWLLALSTTTMAQAEGQPGKPVAEAAAKKAARPSISEPARAALAAAKDLLARCRGLRGPERAKALEAAAGA